MSLISSSFRAITQASIAGGVPALSIGVSKLGQSIFRMHSLRQRNISTTVVQRTPKEVSTPQKLAPHQAQQRVRARRGFVRPVYQHKLETLSASGLDALQAEDNEPSTVDAPAAETTQCLAEEDILEEIAQSTREVSVR
ncbi:hypothetical protein OPT61_g3309 [Boeremia exigua]|uniref:Uncharacterized protein n=1 Tax=Boeremia exigua TaxID=749465 RepID=A0ACC2IIK6_9PLEO|nr:hypothetical protein OPT61_g3309 [Boeremia exigua]